MQAYLDRYIKPVLDQHPALGPLLEQAGIGCTGCGLGTCRIKDILEIHNLDGAASRELLTRMGAIIYGGGPFQVPALERRAAPAKSALCPPIARMVVEHTHILRLLDLIPAFALALRERPQAALALLDEALGFIRGYADAYHHAKEEDILFGFFEPGAEIIQAMLQDHGHGREHVATMAAAIAAGDAGQAEAGLRAYGELLRGHIQREDGILYPWMDRTLSMRQVGELYQRCAEVDARFGAGPLRQEAFVAGLIDRLKALQVG